MEADVKKAVVPFVSGSSHRHVDEPGKDGLDVERMTVGYTSALYFGRGTIGKRRWVMSI